VEIKCVSVVIPYHNRSDTIRRALDSVVRNERCVFELIVIDDASSEAEYKSLLTHLDNYNFKLKLLRNEVNLGAASSRNLGIDAAQGKFVAFLDSDDEWLDFKLESQLKAIGDGDFICSGLRKLTRSSVNEIKPLGGDVAYNLIYGLSHYQTSTFLIRTSSARKVRFSIIPKFQDWDFIIKAQMMGVKIVFHEGMVTNYYEDALGRIGSRVGLEFSEPFLKNLAKYEISKELLKFFRRQQLMIDYMKHGCFFSAFSLLLVLLINRKASILLKINFLKFFVFNLTNKHDR
jgi:glycosyltransferase involved in cell wall biosynthesis